MKLKAQKKRKIASMKMEVIKMSLTLVPITQSPSFGNYFIVMGDFKGAPKKLLLVYQAEHMKLNLKMAKRKTGYHRKHKHTQQKLKLSSTKLRFLS